MKGNVLIMLFYMVGEPISRFFLMTDAEILQRRVADGRYYADTYKITISNLK